MYVCIYIYIYHDTLIVSTTVCIISCITDYMCFYIYIYIYIYIVIPLMASTTFLSFSSQIRLHSSFIYTHVYIYIYIYVLHIYIYIYIILYVYIHILHSSLLLLRNTALHYTHSINYHIVTYQYTMVPPPMCV